MSWRILAVSFMLVSSLATAQLPADNGKPFQDETGQFAAMEKAVTDRIAEQKLPLKVYIAKEPGAASIAPQALTEWKRQEKGIILVITPSDKGVAISGGKEQEPMKMTPEYVRERIASNYFKGEWTPQALEGALLKTVNALHYRSIYPPKIGDTPVGLANAIAQPGVPGGGGNNAAPAKAPDDTKPPIDMKIAVPILIALIVSLAWLTGRSKKTT
jgi:hypothetical protein